jgi:hypothetical protein
MRHIVHNDTPWHNQLLRSVRAALRHFEGILLRAHGNYEE